MPVQMVDTENSIQETADSAAVCVGIFICVLVIRSSSVLLSINYSEEAIDGCSNSQQSRRWHDSPL